MGQTICGGPVGAGAALVTADSFTIEGHELVEREYGLTHQGLHTNQIICLLSISGATLAAGRKEV